MWRLVRTNFLLFSLTSIFTKPRRDFLCVFNAEEWRGRCSMSNLAVRQLRLRALRSHPAGTVIVDTNHVVASQGSCAIRVDFVTSVAEIVPCLMSFTGTNVEMRDLRQGSENSQALGFYCGPDERLSVEVALEAAQKSIQSQVVPGTIIFNELGSRLICRLPSEDASRSIGIAVDMETWVGEPRAINEYGPATYFLEWQVVLCAGTKNNIVLFSRGANGEPSPRWRGRPAV